ncbi:Fe2+-dependent dioxygenase [Roseateles sp.]|uniref:Fe2+-dependent dioxygenase n=1 Tax=Roseateles sp. TaxID=1971397 RepID=UPI0025D5BA33|nr:Fe2+-dependent dioxygenase [Roseateles sp.]MBV8036000.1 Fe2+-dependent dioxygenase [Roseateles sp.]
MFQMVKDVLTAAELHELTRIAGALQFVDGRVSNPHSLAKNNLQVDIGQPEAGRAAQIANAAIMRNEEIRNFVFPKRVAAPLLCRYDPGMTYGVHADSALLPVPGGPLRSDVSGTLWLGDPSSYDGGELRIHLGTEAVTIKGEPGSMSLYPSTTLHEVTPVRSGRRLVMITFIESYIPDQTQRELLWTLNEVNALEGYNITWENRTRLNFISASLHRMWSA